MDLSLGEQKAFINASDLLVKVEVAEAQINREIEAARATAEETSGKVGAQDVGGDDVKFTDPATKTWSDDDSNSEVSAVDATVLNRQKSAFHMVSKLDNTRVNRGIQSIMEEIVSQLNLIGADVELTFEIHARVKDGIPPETVRALSENCSTLGVSDFGFSE